MYLASCYIYTILAKSCKIHMTRNCQIDLKVSDAVFFSNASLVVPASILKITKWYHVQHAPTDRQDLKDLNNPASVLLRKTSERGLPSGLCLYKIFTLFKNLLRWCCSRVRVCVPRRLSYLGGIE